MILLVRRESTRSAGGIERGRVIIGGSMCRVRENVGSGGRGMRCEGIRGWWNGRVHGLDGRWISCGGERTRGSM